MINDLPMSMDGKLEISPKNETIDVIVGRLLKAAACSYLFSAFSPKSLFLGVQSNGSA